MKFKLPVKNKYFISIILSLGALSIVIILTLAFSQQFEEWEEKSLDYRFRLRKSIPIYPAITHIGIEDYSLARYGPWPWKRSMHGKMITFLKAVGVATTTIDLLFPRESNPQEDEKLIKAVKDAGNVILSVNLNLVDHLCFTNREYKQFLTNFPEAKQIVEPIAEQKNDNICVDLEKISEAQSIEMGNEAFGELVMHAEFAYTGEEDRLRVETLLRKFQYLFVLQQGQEVYQANRAVTSIRDLLQSAAGVGHIFATPDSDGVFRRVPLIVRVKDQFIPSLAFASVLHYLQIRPEDVTILPGKHISLHNPRFPEKEETSTDIKIPVDHLLQLRINYPRRWNFYSFVDILEPNAEIRDPKLIEMWKDKLKGHICTIGYSTTGTGDIGPNPIETNFLLALIHQAVINTILTQNFLYDTSQGVNLVITLLLVLFISIVSPKLSPLYFTLTVLLTIAGYIAITIVLFNVFGIILKLVNPVLTVLILAYTLIILYWYATEERERKQLRSAFKTYVSRQMLAKILENPESLSLQGKRKEITILFSDIKAFSTLSDKIEPELIHRLLNLYFSHMTAVAFEYDGFVDKFIGDGLLCFFGDPIFHPDHALRAVRSAIEMQREVRALAPEIRKLGLDPITIRIGINTGYVIVGNMGSSERMEYTVLGSDVNLAQRLEASATPGQVMISYKTYEHVKHEISAREIGEIKVKGFEHPVQVYEVNLPFE